VLLEAYGGTLKYNVLDIYSGEDTSLKFLENAPIIECDEGSLLEFEQLAYGHYSPLDYFPTSEERKRIYQTGLLKGGQTFPIPPLFAISSSSPSLSPSSQAEDIFSARFVKIQFKDKIIGYLELKEVSKFTKEEKEEYCHFIFQTINSSHPGVSYILSLGDVLLAGKPTLFKGRGIFAEGNFLTAREMRKMFTKKEVSNVCAFSTTNVPHRAHEFLIRQVLDTQKAVLIHALHVIGKEGSAKYPLDIVQKTYVSLCEHYLPEEKLFFATFPSLVRSAGPRSSVLQAIIRQNYGCAYQIYGRDHEGFSSLYGKYDSQKAVELAEGIKLQPMCLAGPYYCHKCSQVTSKNSCRHSTDKQQRVDISGKRIREMLVKGNKIPLIFLRQEVLNILQRYYQKNKRTED
jgi:sulfate adenylyltransferase